MPVRETVDARIPVIILEDASGSTEQMKDILNAQMRRMIGTLKRNQFADQVVLSAVHFDEIRQVRADYAHLSGVDERVLDLQDPIGATDTGAALQEALSGFAERKAQWKRNGIRCAAPILLLLTDGAAAPGRGSTTHIVQGYKERYLEAAYQIKVEEQRGALRFAAVGIIQTARYRADIDALKRLTEHPERVFRAEVEYWTDLDLGTVITWLDDEVTRAGRMLQQDAAQEPEQPAWDRSETRDLKKQQERVCRELCLDEFTRSFFGLKDERNP